jgi:hypothetical protein
MILANPLYADDRVFKLVIIAQDPDSSEEIKSDIILALGEIGGVEALSALEEMAIDDEGQTTSNRALAIQAIGKINHPEAVLFLNKELTSDRDSIIQYYTLRALNRIGDRKTIDPLILYIKHTHKNYLAYVPQKISKAEKNKHDVNEVFYAENLKLLFTAIQVLNELDKDEVVKIVKEWAAIQPSEGTGIKAKAQNALKQQALTYLKN